MKTKAFHSLTGLAIAALGATVITGCATAIPGANIKPGASNVAQVEQSSWQHTEYERDNDRDSKGQTARKRR